MIDIGSSVVRETFVLPPLGCLISFGRRGRSALFGATLALGRCVSMSSVCVGMIKAYLEGGDNAGFGSRDPFRKYSGGGGCDGLGKALAESLTEDDCPDSDSRYSAILFGKIVGSSNNNNNNNNNSTSAMSERV